MGSFYRRRGKRLLDVLGAVTGLVASTPIQAVIGAAIRRNIGSPVLFRQSRIGRGGQGFKLLKFRTMRDVRKGEDPLASDAERLTPLGRFLRYTSVDELPELWNVLRGDMSLVGPRPLLPEYVPRYTPEEWRRHEVRPGITGWAQVNGRNELSWEEKFALDVWYVDNVTLRLDLTILWRTVRAVVSAKGVTAAGHVSAPEFRPGV